MQFNHIVKMLVFTDFFSSFTFSKSKMILPFTTSPEPPEAAELQRLSGALQGPALMADIGC